MLTKIANPIYDSVFKYLMEDNRSAKVVLSRLLQKPVLELTMKRNEYTKATKEDISVYRIDFAATILNKDADGNDKKELVTIELQKAWLPSEVARFRKYLSNQYSAEENSFIISEKPLRKQPMHIVTIYLLGHSLPELNHAVTYVYPRLFDQYKTPLNISSSDVPFVDALVHDMIIVQIPLLKGTKIESYLDRLLSVFDQSNVSGASKQEMNVDETLYNTDDEVKAVVQRLKSAYVDDETRQSMQIEDEYASVIDDYEERLAIQKEQLKTSIKMLYDAGIPVDHIAASLKTNIEFVKSVVGK